MDQTKHSRRRFLDILLGTGLLGWLGAILYPVARYLVPPPLAEEAVASVIVGKAADFAPDSGRIFRFGRKPGLLVRTPDGDFKAYKATCTHLDCTVQYKQDLGVIWCPCHNGKYDLEGRNIAGPPPRPLDALRVDLRDGEVHVSRPA